MVVLLGLAGTGESAPSDTDLIGLVFEDQNLNGVRDEGEPGIGGVRVSDQAAVVSTAEDGTFRLQGEAGYGLIYVGQPEGYMVSGPFWREVSSESDAVGLDFPMVKTEHPEVFTFVHASDPHLSEETLARTRRLREIVAERKPDFVLITGDLISDALRVPEERATAQYELFIQELESFPVPVWNALGNHEIFGIERHKSLVSSEHPLYGKKMYRHYLGPNYYSFDFGGVRFVCLDTVAIADLWYHGYVDAVQLAWLQQDLASVEPGKPVVTFNHIPLVTAGASIFGYDEDETTPLFLTIDNEPRYRHTVGNPEEVLTELRKHNYPLALGGHFHTREKLFFETGGIQTRFHLASSVKGDYLDAMGLQMVSGVTLYRVSNGEIDDGTFIPLD